LDIEGIIADLRAELARIDEAIDALVQLGPRGRGRPPNRSRLRVTAAGAGDSLFPTDNRSVAQRADSPHRPIR
jgi:hypothetical protein